MKGLKAKIALTIAAALAASAAVAADPSETAREIVQVANAFRKAQGLRPVGDNTELAAAAQAFARYMARTGKYGHSADGRQPSERAAAHGYAYCIVSENIAYQYCSRGFASAAALAQVLVEGWKDSPEHRENMVDPAVTDTGVGVAQGEDGRYFAVQMFGRPKSASIRFSVANRSGETVRYHAGEHRYTLDPRVTRTHMVCRPVSLSIPGKSFRTRVEGSARYTVNDDRVATGP